MLCPSSLFALYVCQPAVYQASCASRRVASAYAFTCRACSKCSQLRYLCFLRIQGCTSSQRSSSGACVWGADQDSVRLLAVESCGPLARLLPREDAATHILPVVQKFAVVRPAHCALTVSLRWDLWAATSATRANAAGFYSHAPTSVWSASLLPMLGIALEWLPILHGHSES